jgi:arabinogalactan endo-1,4-beta-galactosidase
LIVDAQEGLPQIENRILALTTGLQELVKGQTEQMRSLLEATATGIRDTSQEVSSLLLEGTTKTQEKMGVKLEELLNKNNAQFDRLEQSMEDELNKALTSFGYQLTSLSEKFVNDYMPLTDKLRDLVTAVEK